MKSKILKSLPVIMYHYVSRYPNSIAVTPELFEEHCRGLAERGWKGIGLDEAEAFLLRGEQLPPRSCLITFDDGYLDNYVYAWPILSRYGHKGVIFAVAELIGSTPGASKAGLRNTLSDVWSGHCKTKDLPAVDAPMQDSGFGYQVRRDLFFNWEEARAMERSGTMRIAAHSLRHESVFSGPAYSGFYQPGEQKRTFFHTWPRLFWGHPQFRPAPELSCAGFIPSSELCAAIKKIVPQEEGAACNFFRQEDNLAKLNSLAQNFSTNLGRYESLAEQTERIRLHMKKNQEILQRELGQRCRSFCWPWGKGSDIALQAGLDAGFEVFFTTECGVNPPGRPLAVSRFKGKSRPASWLLSRLNIYSRPFLGSIYSRLHN